jgi:hypothetical protein
MNTPGEDDTPSARTQGAALDLVILGTLERDPARGGSRSCDHKWIDVGVSRRASLPSRKRKITRYNGAEFTEAGNPLAGAHYQIRAVVVLAPRSPSPAASAPPSRPLSPKRPVPRRKFSASSSTAVLGLMVKLGPDLGQ